MVRHWLALSQTLFTSCRMNERDLVMVDAVHKRAQALENAGSDAQINGDYQKAADKFREAADILRKAGDYNMSSLDSDRAGTALEAEGGRKMKAGDMKGAEKAFKGAAENMEAAAQDDLKTKSPFRNSDAEMHYRAAGEDRLHAGASAEVGGKKGEAARNYSKGQDDFERAADAAKKQGHKSDASYYHKRADKAGEAAEQVANPHNKL